MSTYTCSKCGESGLGMYGHHDHETDGFACDKKKKVQMNIDINKKYTTRGGQPVRFYATDGSKDYPIHGAILQNGQWYWAAWNTEGQCDPQSAETCNDLIPVKTWRAWMEGEAPLRIMIRRKGSTAVETKRTRDCDLVTLFIHYVRVHEDGTTTPCGVCE